MIKLYPITVDEGCNICLILKIADIAETNSKASEMVNNGKVSINGQVCLDVDAIVVPVDVVSCNDKSFEVI